MTTTAPKAIPDQDDPVGLYLSRPGGPGLVPLADPSGPADPDVVFGWKEAP